MGLVAAVEGCTDVGLHDDTANAMTALVSCVLCRLLELCGGNYDPTAFYPECVFAEDGYDCDGICIAACGGCTICSVQLQPRSDVRRWKL